MTDAAAEAILEQIRACHAQLEAHAAEAGTIRAERDRLIVEALDAGVPGPVIGSAAGFNRHQRVYQIHAAVKAGTA